MIRLLIVALLSTAAMPVMRADGSPQLPPAPARYVSDEAGVIPSVLVDRLNAQLANFERTTSSQIVAAVYRKLPDGETLEDYAQRLYSAWGIGSRKNSNGVLILVFVDDRKVRIQPGYGLEGALPDAVCSRIIRETMAPAFRSGNYGAGLSSALSLVMQATRGEYKGRSQGSGKGNEGPPGLKDLLFSPLGFFLLVLGVLVLVSRNRRQVGPGDGIGPGGAAATGFFLGGMGSGGGGGSGGDAGGFSGGGGESGGGGASGDW